MARIGRKIRSRGRGYRDVGTSSAVVPQPCSAQSLSSAPPPLTPRWPGSWDQSRLSRLGWGAVWVLTVGACNIRYRCTGMHCVEMRWLHGRLGVSISSQSSSYSSPSCINLSIFFLMRLVNSIHLHTSVIYSRHYSLSCRLLTWQDEAPVNNTPTPSTGRTPADQTANVAHLTRGRTASRRSQTAALCISSRTTYHSAWKASSGWSFRHVPSSAEELATGQCRKLLV